MPYARRRGPPIRLILGLIVVAIAALVGGVFYYAGKAEENRPEQREIRVEAQNVGPF